MTPNSRQASARFFIRVGQVGRSTEERDTLTRPLFPLPLILDTEGMLSKDARHLVRASDAETSRKAAALSIELRGKHCAAIFAFLLEHPEGATYREVASGIGMEPVAVGRRLKELRVRAGVYADGERDGMQIWKVRR